MIKPTPNDWVDAGVPATTLNQTSILKN